MFPGAGQDFLAGLKGALADGGVPHDIVVEPTGACAVKDVVTDRIQRLLLQHTPDVVTGIMGAGLSRHVHTFFSGGQTPFIVNDIGGDPLLTGGAPDPYVFCNTLNVWQSMHALGYWASQHLGSKACIAAAFHDAGYGIVQAFWLGFAEAGGGTVLATQVTHRETADDDPTEQVRMIRDLEPDFVMGFYAGREGISFVNAWTALGCAGTIPLLATPLMAHELWLPKMAEGVAGVRTAFSWDAGAEPEEHERFRHVCPGVAGREPAVFALLGYETGRMLCAAVARAGGAAGGPALHDALAGVECTSPRGRLRLDPDTGEVATVDYLMELQRGADGTVAPRTIGPLDLAPSCRADYESLKRQDARSGWLNPYLVT
jgi:branched-chain amino acid transport system substrate-binding protein